MFDIVEQCAGYILCNWDPKMTLWYHLQAHVLLHEEQS